MKERVVFVVANYYEDVTLGLLEGGRRRVDALGVEEVGCYYVSGALEIPAAIVRIDAERGDEVDGYVAFGCVIRGETTHYESVSSESVRGLMDLGLEGLAIGNGILTCETKAQALVRADVGDKDKGGGAVEACVKLMRLFDGGL
jgi:6,7-dimethyl-8-ribityllumazine synthase